MNGGKKGEEAHMNRINRSKDGEKSAKKVRRGRGGVENGTKLPEIGGPNVVANLPSEGPRKKKTGTPALLK